MAQETPGPTSGDGYQVGVGACGPARSRGEQLAGKLLIILTLISFIFVGLLLNACQLLLALTSRLSFSERWRRLHKRANGHLLYAIFAQPIFLLYTWSRVQLNVVLADGSLQAEVAEPMLGLVIANHTFELDWMACFILADQLGNMGGYKCFAKAELKYLPIIGWAFWMSDLVYVRRDWRRDRLAIAGQLDELLVYDQILLGLFAEGTRWTAEKQADAEAFARARRLEPYKHHLFPRPRGFNYTLRHYLRREALEPRALNGKRVRVFNLELALPGRPKFADFLAGRQLRADVYCEEVELSEQVRREALESHHEDECPQLTQLLRDIFRRKDQLLEEYERHGQRFVAPEPQRAGTYPVRWPLKACVYYVASMSLTYGTLGRLAFTTFAHSAAFWSCAAGLLAAGVLLLRRIEFECQPTRLRSAAAPDARKIATKLT